MMMKAFMKIGVKAGAAAVQYMPIISEVILIASTAKEIYDSANQVYSVFKDKSEFKARVITDKMHVKSYNILMDYQACNILS
jgi:hypothetical protein